MAILPSIVILRLVYKKDIEKEPIKLLLGMFGLGIISCFVTLQLTDILELIFPFLITEYEDGLNFVQLFSYVFISVALIEEFSKWLFNYTVVWNNKHFNHFYDSIVYSVIPLCSHLLLLLSIKGICFSSCFTHILLLCGSCWILW